MEIHLWMYGQCDGTMIRELSELDKAIERRDLVINTILPVVLNHGYDKLGYKIIAHSYGRKVYEIKPKEEGNISTSDDNNDAFAQYNKGARMV